MIKNEFTEKDRSLAVNHSFFIDDNYSLFFLEKDEKEMPGLSGI